MAWGDYALADYAADKSMRTGKVSYLAERDLILYQRPIAIEIAEGTQTLGTFNTIATFSMATPSYLLSSTNTVTMKGYVQGKVSSANGYLRLVIGSNNGTTSAVITSTSYVDVYIECVVPAAGGSITIEGYNDGGGPTTYCKNDSPRATFWIEVT